MRQVQIKKTFNHNSKVLTIYSLLFHNKYYFQIPPKWQTALLWKNKSLGQLVIMNILGISLMTTHVSMLFQVRKKIARCMQENCEPFNIYRPIVQSAPRVSSGGIKNASTVNVNR